MCWTKPRYKCWYCNATFTRNYNRQIHKRRDHGRICPEQEANLQLHLEHLSESDDFQNEWMFVESRPIKPDEHNVCPFGQAPIHSYFFLENKFNGNRTFVGSTCLGNIDPKANAVIDYFKHILEKDVQGTRQSRSTKIYSKIKHHTSMSFKGCRTFKPSSNKKPGRAMGSLSEVPRSRDFDCRSSVFS